MSNIYLVGMMGAGKSLCGELLAKKWKRSHHETDRMIEMESGLDIAEIFEREGEISFRKREKDTLKKVSREKNTVISTGGGIVIDPDNIALMKRTGTIVYLKASAEKLWQRVKGSTVRPLLKAQDPLARLKELLSERAGFYEQADITIDTDGKSPEEVVREIEECIGKKN